ncbi:MAG: GNAT family N-acetyltransferase [Desulfarculaceae bacterium]|nr:GNAT family N-acetyltransferase [Desulfarculaceae bacterium]
MRLPSSSTPEIRSMQPSDLDQIVAIDIKVLGRPRPEYWETKLELVAKRSQMAGLVAELEGRVVGFIIGGASRWEYGMPENIGWIDTIGVDPDFQRRHIADTLFARLTADLKAQGVDSVHTFVKKRDWRLLKFFHHLGFAEGDMVNLELDL